jgi:YD repeat-containing protein
VPGTAQSCNWSITPGLATTAARIRVIATENGTGTNAQDDSDADFTILNNFTSPRAARSYQYDKLNRLERIDYEDDSYVTYTYDKDGNRTEKTHIQP